MEDVETWLGLIAQVQKEHGSAFAILDARQGLTIASAPRRLPNGDSVWDGVQVDIHDAKMAEERRLLLMKEMSHRIKNNLSTVLSIATQTGRQAETYAAFNASFQARLKALAKSHDLLMQDALDSAEPPSEALAAVVTLPLGMTQGKEYAELEWPIDILIAVTWVAYAVVFFGTVGIRKVSHIYVANWFFGAFIIAVALLHIVNSAAIPVSLTKSYSAYAGVQDAMVQWWYGHNAVGFFLTAGFLGMMYYYIPKQAGRPVYSYRLSIVHFWALIFTYMWAGPHHLHYTALPDWAQSIGMIFSLVLLAPSWGGMINGIMTLSGAWHKLRDDPILKFLIVSLSFYGMSTFEGPMMSIKTVNSLSHYTDWTIGHVHSGALGWVAMITIGSVYALLPKLVGRQQMASMKLVETHFWVHTVGVVFYIASMWIAGVMQGLMWRATDADGNLAYTFVESLKATYPYYLGRLAGGVLVLAGMLMMAVNVARTMAEARRAAPAGAQPAAA